MYLKALELTGFKSFADKTIIDFTKGITAIVGPNGSGKSNILDGILWVLGEQSYKNIRAKESSDVIFSGGKNKKAKSMAEVSLIIDNEDRFLDIDLEEVKITRRIYKTGENEYLINNRKTRLKDINNMFMDTGIGKQAYSIIGQGRVERIISSNPRELKEIIEEAAGVKRAKQEKDVSIKKLTELKNEIEKIDLVIKEKEKLIDTLQEEEKKVQLHEEYTEQINLLSTILYDYRIEKLNTLKEETQTLKKEESENIENLINVIRERSKNQLETEQNLEKLSVLLEEVEKKYEENVLMIGKKKDEIVSLRNKITNIDVEKNEKERRYNIVEQEIEEKKEQLSDLKSKMEELSNDFENKKNEKNQLEQMVENLKSKLVVLEDKIRENSKNTQNYEIEQIKIIHENEDIQKRINTATAYINRVQSEYDEVNEQLQKQKQEADELNAQKEIECKNKNLFEEELRQLKKDLELQQFEHSELNNKINSIKYQLENLKSRKRAIENIINSNDTFYKGVKFVLSQKKDGVLGAFINLINVPAGYEMAFQTLAGSNFQDIVVESADVAKELIEILKKRNMGRASFIPIDTIKVYENSSNIPREKLNQISGFIGFASEIVTHDKTIQKVIDFVFGKAIIVENMEIGVKISKMGYKDRIVTIDGDIITVRGRMTGGSVSKIKDELLFRKNELNQILLDIDKNEKQLVEYNGKEENYKNNISNKQQLMKDKLGNYKIFKEKYEELVEKCDVSTNNLNKLEKHLITVSYEIKEMKKDLDNRKKQVVDNENTFEKNKEAIENNKIYLEKLFEEKSSLEDVSMYSDQLNKITTDYEIIKVKYESHKNRYDESEKEYNKLMTEKNEIYNFYGESSKIKSNIHNIINELEENYDQNKELQVINEKLMKIIRNKIKDENDKYQKNTIDTKEKEFLLENKKDNYKKYSNNLDKILQNIAKENDKISNIDLEENRNHRDYYELANEEEEEEITNELNKADRNRMSLGVIDLNKVNIYKKTKELYDELILQREDLFNSRNTMIEFISGIEEEIEYKFSNAFKEINKNFEYMCKTILNDAKGLIRLTDSENLLDTGVELSVKYKNKPEQTLMLLSGGEKSMLAVSFIMSIFLFKPSPFTFFDEIEAALDEANTKKIIEILKEFTEKSQFILITHNKETMKGADRLYGITMNKEVGESKVIMVDI